MRKEEHMESGGLFRFLMGYPFDKLKFMVFLRAANQWYRKL